MDILGTIKSVVGTVAPTLATALGGPLAGMATKAIVGALGLTDDAAPAEIAKALQGATPEQMLALKRADQEFAVKMRELDVDLERIAAGDRDSARKRQADTKDWTPSIIGVLIVGAWIGINAWLLNYPELTQRINDAVMYRILGTLDAALMIFLAYLYGSTAGSAKKTDLLAKSEPPKG